MATANICHGCLSDYRQLFIVEEHVKLYRQLLLKKPNTNIKKLMMCWECNKILNNIHSFRMKITQAQKLLNEKSLSCHSVLSNLTITKKVDDYEIIIYEDEKINLSPIVIEDHRSIKEENFDFKLETQIEDNDDVQLKEELYEKDEIEDGYFNSDDDKDFITQVEEVLEPVKLPENKEEVKVRQRRKKRSVHKKKYTTIILDDIKDKRKYYDVMTVDMNIIKQDMERKKEKSSSQKFQCQRCYSGFAQPAVYKRHLAARHAQYNKYECDICGIRFPVKVGLVRHVSEHYRRFRCALCGALFRERALLYAHFEHGPHRRRMECNECGASFDSPQARDFFAHYRSMHLGIVVCDYCGIRCTKKSRLAHHIRIRHSEFRCNICDVSFSKYNALTNHNIRKHVFEAAERNYCVECDLQLGNNFLYREHVTRSVKHRVKPRVPCPECDKSYSRRCYMMNHYNLEHLKTSKYVCPICNRSFLNRYRLWCHVTYSHEKAPKPRNHICSYCQKGFHTRRILDNHVRTHTGERPFACAHCPAAFTQDSALKTHERSAHK